METANLLRHWRYRAHRVQIGHYEAGRRYDVLNLWLGIPSIVLSTIVGSAVFASLAEPSHGIPITILVGLLSVSTAVLTGLQTFLKYSELAERHKVAGARFADIKHQIELVATFQKANVSELKSRLKEIEARWEQVREESPNIPPTIWDRIEKKMTLENDIESHPNFGQIA